MLTKVRERCERSIEGVILCDCVRREEAAGLGWRAEVGRRVRSVEAVALRVFAIVAKPQLIKRD